MSAALLAAAALTLHAGPNASRPLTRSRVAALVRADARLAGRVLATDVVPQQAARLLGPPALAALAQAAAKRRAAGLRIRLLRSELAIVSIRLLRGGEEAVVVARWRQELEPLRGVGRPAGQPVELDERARLELRRAPEDGSTRIWSVELLG